MYQTISAVVSILKRILPARLIKPLLPFYHRSIGWLFALGHGFPAKRMTIIGVTGTKGKSSVCDMLYSVLLHAGYPVAVAGTIRFAIKHDSHPNTFKMTMQGRGFLQDFLARARREGCTHAVLEVTSEGVREHRHKYLSLDALIFTNLQKEHIESHGSFENYEAAKWKIGEELAHSSKRPRAIIPNGDSEYGRKYLALPVEEKHPFSYAEAKDVELSPGHAAFTYEGVRFTVQLPGSFSVMNSLAVIKAAQFAGVPLPKIAEALAVLERIPGRTERIEEGQPFTAVVDYAHTPDSLLALYAAYPGRKICVLGNTGGGRDTWKRPEMGGIADRECAEVILTDEDPYDEDPVKIVEEMAAGMKRKPRIIIDRREAIATALGLAQPGDSVLITGKGTDPCIMRANGKREEWSDAQVVREELQKLQ